MKIMIAAAAYLPIPAFKGGATETLITELLEQVKSEDGLQIEVFSNCAKEPGFSDGDDTVKYRYIPRTLFDRVYTQFFRILRILTFKRTNIPSAFARRLCKTVDLKKFDVIIAEGDKNQVPFFRKHFKKTLILHIHTVMTFTKDTPAAKKFFDKCDYIWGNSVYTKEVISAIEPDKAEKVIAFPNCIDVASFKLSDREKVRQEIRNQYNIKDTDFVYIYCGRMEPGKGVKELVKAFSLCGENSKLMIVGSSWFSSDKKTAYIKEITAISKDIKDRIIFTGYIPHSEIAKYYSAADYCVVPSIYKEAACLVVLEAQASGLRVIASNIGGIPEFAFGGTSTLIDVDDAFEDRLSEAMIKAQSEKYPAEKSEELEEFLKKNDTEQYYINFKKILKKAEENLDE